MPNKSTKRSNPNTITDTYSDYDIEGVSTYFWTFIVLKSIEEKPTTNLSLLQ